MVRRGMMADLEQGKPMGADQTNTVAPFWVRDRRRSSWLSIVEPAGRLRKDLKDRRRPSLALQAGVAYQNEHRCPALPFGAK